MRFDLNFGSDNVVGASPPVLEAIVQANDGALPSYGADAITRDVEEAFARLFEREVSVALVATGTAANALALATALTPWGACICHEEAHVIDDECGAPEFYSHGAKLIGLPGVGSKLSAERVERLVAGLPASVKQMPPQAISLSQGTESGLVYGLDEIAHLSGVARRHGLTLHMDGARFANALVRLGCSPAEMTWKRGVDILSFGGTKNGCLAAEAIVVFDPALAESLGYRRKRAGHTFSKGRFLAAQFRAYLAHDHWLANARHANRMAADLSEGLVARAGARLAWPTEINEVFAILPKAAERRLREGGVAGHPWSERSLAPGEPVGPDEVLMRYVTSFATRPEAVSAALGLLQEAQAA